MSTTTVAEALKLLEQHEALLAHQTGLAAHALAEAALDAERAGSAEETLAPLEGPLDAFLVPASALFAYGTDEPGLRAAVVAVDTLAARIPAQHEPGLAMIEAVLGRSVLALCAIGLTVQRPAALLRLAGVTRSDGYGNTESVLTDSSLRHLTLYDRGAAEAYAATEAWWRARPWRSEIGALAHEDTAVDALAEAEVLTACLRAQQDERVFSAGISRQHRRVADRIVGRLRAPEQRPAICRLFEVGDAHLDETVAALYGKLSSGDGWGRELPLFAR